MPDSKDPESTGPAWTEPIRTVQPAPASPPTRGGNCTRLGLWVSTLLLIADLVAVWLLFTPTVAFVDASNNRACQASGFSSGCPVHWTISTVAVACITAGCFMLIVSLCTMLCRRYVGQKTPGIPFLQDRMRLMAAVCVCLGGLAIVIALVMHLTASLVFGQQ